MTFLQDSFNYDIRESETYRFSAFLLRFRDWSGWSQSKLARYLGLASNTTIYQWEKGSPPAEYVEKLVRFYLLHTTKGGDHD